MFLDGLDIARVVELSEAVAKVAYTGQDEFLGSDLSVLSLSGLSFGEVGFGGGDGYLCVWHIFG